MQRRTGPSKKVHCDFLLRGRSHSLAVYSSLPLSLSLCVFSALECTSLPKKTQGWVLSSRYSNAARVSENIRLRRRAAIFAAPMSDEVFSARPRHSDFYSWESRQTNRQSSCARATKRSRYRLRRPWRVVARRVGFSTEPAKVSFIGKLRRLREPKWRSERGIPSKEQTSLLRWRL